MVVRHLFFRHCRIRFDLNDPVSGDPGASSHLNHVLTKPALMMDLDGHFNFFVIDCGQLNDFKSFVVEKDLLRVFQSAAN